MRREDALGESPGLEKCEAEQHGIAHHCPDGCDNVVGERDGLDQHGVDPDTDHDQESLEAEGREGPQVILADLALLSVPEGREGDRCQADHEIDLDHSSVNNDEDQDRQDQGTQLHHEVLQEQSEERPEFHLFQRLLYGFQCRGVNSSIAADNAGAGIYHMLGDIKDRHRNVECVRDQHDCHERLEYPFEEYPCLKVCKVVVIDDQLDQLIAGDEREDQARNGNDHRFRDIPHKTEYSG